MNKKITRTIITCAIVLQAGFAQAGLIISEYVEGTSNNKALELFNTGPAIDFGSSPYSLELYFNASTTPSRTITLTGSVDTGSTFVIAHSGSVDALTMLADQTTTSLGFNGNDSVVLKQADTIIDSFGLIGANPALGWGVGSTLTANNTLRRLASIVSGDVDIFDVFDPVLQWVGFGADDFSGLGQHALVAGTDPVLGDPSAGVQKNAGAVNVPEPGTILLLLLGIAGLLLMRTGRQAVVENMHFAPAAGQGA